MVRRAPRFADVCDQLLGALEGHVFVAHNAGFDWRFLSTEVERATRRPLVGQSLCTVRMARQLRAAAAPPESRFAVSDYYGIENTRGIAPAAMPWRPRRCFLRLLEAARDRGCETLDDLERCSRAVEPAKPATQAPAAGAVRTCSVATTDR